MGCHQYFGGLKIENAFHQASYGLRNTETATRGVL